MFCVDLDGSYTTALRGSGKVGYQRRKTTNVLYMTDREFHLPYLLQNPRVYGRVISLCYPFAKAGVEYLGAAEGEGIRGRNFAYWQRQ